MAATPHPSSARPFLIVLTLFACFCAVIFQALPFGNVDGIPISPVLPLILLFYWAVHRPEYAPSWIAFLTGLFQDFVSGGPPGMWALIYLVIFESVVWNRHFFMGRAAYSDWGGFCMAAIVTAALAWLIGCLYYWHLLSPLPVLGQLVVTALCYPVVARIMQGADAILGSGTDP